MKKILLLVSIICFGNSFLRSSIDLFAEGLSRAYKQALEKSIPDEIEALKDKNKGIKGTGLEKAFNTAKKDIIDRLGDYANRYTTEDDKKFVQKQQEALNKMVFDDKEAEKEKLALEVRVDKIAPSKKDYTTDKEVTDANKIKQDIINDINEFKKKYGDDAWNKDLTNFNKIAYSKDNESGLKLKKLLEDKIKEEGLKLENDENYKNTVITKLIGQYREGKDDFGNIVFVPDAGFLSGYLGYLEDIYSK